eukprot:8387870-Pyramimonas_sp.AAC.1
MGLDAPNRSCAVLAEVASNLVVIPPRPPPSGATIGRDRFTGVAWNPNRALIFDRSLIAPPRPGAWGFEPIADLSAMYCRFQVDVSPLSLIHI